MDERIRLRPKARRDLVNEVLCLLEDDPDVAERFQRAVEETANSLLAQPGMGSPSEWGPTADTRFFPVHGFPRHFVFYRPFADGLLIVRILHGSRDLPAIVGEDGA
jgi:toxin ParE1/3/4